jgi:hypothetical protein
MKEVDGIDNNMEQSQETTEPSPRVAEVPKIAEAARLMHNMIVADDLVEFLTLPAYELLD